MLLSPTLRRLLPAAVLVFAAVFVYAPAIGSAFVWDDDIILWNNPLIHSPGGLGAFWFSTEPPDYFPLSSSMLWFEWRVFGASQPWGYHLGNVLLHAGSSLLLWRLLACLKIPGAWFAALVFVLHPVNVESVAWIAQRKSALSLMLGLLSSLLYFRDRDREDEARSPFASVRYRWALVVFLLALLAKTMVALLPAAFLVLTWWRFGSIGRRDLMRTLPFLIVAGVLSMVTIWFQTYSSIGDDIVREDGFFSRLAISGWAVWFYLSKAIVPLGLSFMYPRWVAEAGNPIAYLPLLVFFLGLFYLWRQRSRPWARGAFAALAVYTLMLFPVLGFFDIYFMRYSLVADHWQYAALPVVVAVTVAGAVRLARGVDNVGMTRIFAALVIVVLAVLSWREATEYHDNEALWRATIKSNSRAWAAHRNLGVILFESGRSGEAIDHLRMNLELGDDPADAHVNLAAALMEHGDLEEAAHHYRRAVEFDPELKDVWYTLGNLLFRMEKVEEAIDGYQRCLELDPGYAYAHANLGNALASLGRTSDAVTHYQRALGIDGSLVIARYNLGNTLLKMGRFEEAVSQFETALEVQPEDSRTLMGLAWILATCPDASIRDGARSFELATRAVRHVGAQPGVLRALAAAMAEVGRMEDAVKVVERAIELASFAGDQSSAEEMREELKLYLDGSPVRSAASGFAPGAPSPK